MITYLKGSVYSIGLDHVVIDVQGVGYHVVCSHKTLENLVVDETVLLTTELVIRDDAHLLYGFQSTEERDMYRMLVSVQGVGSRVAMALLSWGTPGDLIRAIQEENKDLLCQAEGIGPRLAARLITELKDHVKKLVFIRCEKTGVETSFASPSSSSPYANDAKSALSSLGYRPQDIDRAFDKVFQQGHEVQSLQHLIRLSLQHLGKTS